MDAAPSSAQPAPKKTDRDHLLLVRIRQSPVHRPLALDAEAVRPLVHGPALPPGVAVAALSAKGVEVAGRRGGYGVTPLVDGGVVAGYGPGVGGVGVCGGAGCGEGGEEEEEKRGKHCCLVVVRN